MVGLDRHCGQQYFKKNTMSFFEYPGICIMLSNPSVLTLQCNKIRHCTLIHIYKIYYSIPNNMSRHRVKGGK
jgi:hypothetical protein